MRTPAGTECRHYYQDFHRGRELQECRLILGNRESVPWRPELCAQCQVPAVLRANGSPDLRLRLTVRKRLGLFTRLELEARCTAHDRIIEDPYVGCPECAHELPGLDVDVG
jgi:hypothetical protein